MLEALNKVNLTGGTAGAARVKAEWTTPKSPEVCRTLFIKSASGDMLTVTEGAVQNEPRTTIRAMQKGRYMVVSLSSAPLFTSSFPESQASSKLVSYTTGPAASAALPRLTMSLSGPLVESDILAVERLSREGEQLEQYKIQTNLFLNPDRPFPSSIIVTYDSATRRIVRTITPIVPGGAGAVFDLTYDNTGRLAQVDSKSGDGHVDKSWKILELDLSPTAAPAELTWEMIGLGVGAQVSGWHPDAPEVSSFGFWTGDSILPLREFKELGFRASSQVLMQMEETKYTDELPYEFAEALVLSEMERVRLGLETLSPWKSMVSRFGKTFALPPDDIAKADKILEKAEERVREIATRFSDDRKSAARIELLELQSMRKRSSDDKDRKDQEEQRRARKLFEDFWKELKRLTRADVSDWDRRFEIEAE